MKRDHSIIGQVFGRLTVTEWVSSGKVKCQCSCGNITIVTRSHLWAGNTKSCGCFGKEYPSHLIHGYSKTSRIYTAWESMKTRCTNPKCEQYPNYGGRGIKVCALWAESFESFLSDMGPAPTYKHSLDRINVDGDYCPENCRWATPEEQARNKTTTQRLTYQGKTLTIMEWSNILSIPYKTIWARIKLSWPIERVLTEPVRARTTQVKI